MPENMITSLGYNEQALKLCIDSNDKGNVAGKVVSMRLSRPIEFFNLNDFIMKMEAVMDLQNFPQSFQRKRGFKGIKADVSRVIEEATSGTPTTKEEMEAACGALSTFTVRILSRQNSSWQGHVVFPGVDDIAPFQSELELLDIITKYI